MGTNGSVTTDNITSEDLKNIEIMRALKPYLAKALTMNHDINNPLCAILGYTEFILSEEDLDPDFRANLEQIQRAGERIRTMVESLCAEKIAASEQIDLSSLLDHH